MSHNQPGSISGPPSPFLVTERTKNHPFHAKNSTFQQVLSVAWKLASRGGSVGRVYIGRTSDYLTVWDTLQHNLIVWDTLQHNLTVWDTLQHNL